MAVPAPTPRLVFREFTEADLPALAALLADPEVMRYSWGGPLDRTTSAVVLRQFQSHCRVHGFGKWALALPTTGEFAGYCGVEPCPSAGPSGYELAYRLPPHLWGQGLAAEAAAAAVRHLFAHTALTEIFAFVDPANVASVRVLATAGFRRIQEAAVLNGKTLDIHRCDRAADAPK